MADLSLNRNDPAIGFSNKLPVITTMAPHATDVETIIATLIEKASDLETLVEGKVTKGEVKTEIAFGSELVKIQGDEVVIVGNLTVVDLVNEQNGTTTGQIAESITRIIGGLVQTGAIISNNFGGAEGTAIDLDNETITMGGSIAPKFYYDGAGNLTMSGTLDVGSIITSSVTVDGVTLATISTDADAGATHSVISGSNPHNVPLSTVSGDLDDIADGANYFKSTSAQNTGGTRAVNALDSSFDYIRSISTQNIVVSGSNPANGIVIDDTGIRGYSASSLTFEISNAGNSTWSGNISTDGQVLAEGSTTSSSETGAILGIPTTSGISGIVGKVTGGINPAVLGSSTAVNGTGVTGSAFSSGSSGVIAANTHVSGNSLTISHTAAGVGINMGTPKISGDVNFLDDVDIDLTLIVGGNATFNGTTSTFNSALVVSGANTTTLNGAVTINDTLDVVGVTTITGDLTVNGDSNINVDRSAYFGTDGVTGTSSVVIGGTGQTGKNTLVIKEGTAGSLVANELHLYGQLSGASSKTTFGIVSEQTVVAATGSFNIVQTYPQYINGVQWYIGLSVAA